MRNAMNHLRNVLVAGLLVTGLVTLCGCDPTGMSTYVPYAAYGYGYSGLYDPTADIQGVIANRQAAMEASADGWDGYMLE